MLGRMAKQSSLDDMGLDLGKWHQWNMGSNIFLNLIITTVLGFH
jgi:hypothetical protein